MSARTDLHRFHNDALTARIAALREAVESLLRTSPEGLSEMTLLRQLQREPWRVLGSIDFRSPAALYPVHFLLFHVLYQWREDLIRENLALEISPLCIRLRPTLAEESQAAGFHDPLQAFYLDIDNLDLSEAAINDMVDDFWRGVPRPQDEQLESACHRLEVDCPPQNLADAKHQFRRLAMRQHPDRGGSTQQLQQLNDAMAVVRQYFRHQQSLF